MKIKKVKWTAWKSRHLHYCYTECSIGIKNYIYFTDSGTWHVYHKDGNSMDFWSYGF